MTKGKLTLQSAGALVVTSVLVLGTTHSSHANGELKVIASGDATKESYGDSTVDVNYIEQASDGKYTSLTLTVNNNSDTNYQYFDANTNRYSFDDTSMSGISLHDEESGTTYFPLRDASKECLCPAEKTEYFLGTVKSGSSGTYWASFLIAEDVKKVNVEFPGYEPVEVDIE